MVKRNFLFTVLLLFVLFFQQPATAQYAIPTKMKWWYESRFGMFIHFGSYSYLAKGEWDFYFGGWTKGNYQTQVSSKFNPVNFNAGYVAHLAKNAGMKYIVITAKHHEGFCMWQTNVQSFKDTTGTKLYDLPDFTVFKSRDILKELKDSCEALGIKFCLYYSIMDWNHFSQNGKKATGTFTVMTSFPARTQYILDMKAQLSELITKYHPAIIWFDGDWTKNAGAPTLTSWWTKADGVDLYNYLMALDPNVIINERVCRSFGIGDYTCPEQSIPLTPESRPWETNQTMNGSWGYNATDNNYKSSKTLIQQLVQVVSRDGNYLLNIGPMGDGTITGGSVTILQDFATWMKTYSESIYGTTRSPFPTEPTWGLFTKKSGKLYAHVFTWPLNYSLEIPSIANTITKIYLLNDTTKSLKYTDINGTIKVSLPFVAPNSTNSVVVVKVVGKPRVFGTLGGIDALNVEINLVQNTLSSAVIGISPGTYIQSAKDSLSNSLTKAKTISSANTDDEIENMAINLTSALNTFKSAVNYAKITLTTGDYYIKKAGTNLFWTNTGVNKLNITYYEESPVFQTEIPGSNDQLYHISILSNNRYEIDSKSDVPAYINEAAKIRRDLSSFKSGYNSFNIFYNGTSFAIQPDGSSAYKGFWILSSDVVTTSGVSLIDMGTNFILDIVKKVVSSVPDNKKSLVKMISQKDGIQIIQDQQSVISVFSTNGSLLKTVSASGNTSVSLSSGLYLVKIKSEDSSIVEKILVK